MKQKLCYFVVVLVFGMLVMGCVSQKDYSEMPKDVSEFPDVEQSSPMPAVVQQPKKVMPPSFEASVPPQIVPVVVNSVEKKVNKTVVPLSIVPTSSLNHVPVEVKCVGPSDNDISVRETVIRMYEDGTSKEFADTCKGTDYLYVVQCSKVLKARSVSCRMNGMKCVDGACVKK